MSESAGIIDAHEEKKLIYALSWALGASADFDPHYASIIAPLAKQQRNFWVQ